MHVQRLFSLKNKIALVTGGAGLYGVCISRALGEAGAKVVIASRNIKNCQIEAGKLKAQGMDIKAEHLDLSSEQSIVDLGDKIISEEGKIDILVNNAVIRPLKGFDSSADNWDVSMKVNAAGLYLCSKIFISQMVKQNRGNIINISSIYGMVGPDFSIYEGTDMENPPDYAFHKAGMINFTRYLATRFARYNIRVNCISPGGLYTGQAESFVNNYIKRTPLGRMANEDDIKGAIVFLASDASAYVTGENLVVDGGWTAW